MKKLTIHLDSNILGKELGGKLSSTSEHTFSERVQEINTNFCLFTDAIQHG